MSRGAPVAEADAVVRVPRTDAFIADDHVGLEHFFVIASAGPLAATDPALAALLAAAQDKAGAPCTATLAMTTDESRAAAKLPAIVPPAGAPAPAPRTKPPAYSPVAAIWIPRGFGVGETAGTSSHQSDAAGIASWAITIDDR